MGVRAGQGFGQNKPKRMPCPECSKRGVTGWAAGPTGISRYCQYCQASWGEAGWDLALRRQGGPEPLTPDARIRDLFGRYWDLAFREGKTGVNQAEAANALLHSLEQELARAAGGLAHPAQALQWRARALAQAQSETMPPMSAAGARQWWFEKGVFAVTPRPVQPVDAVQCWIAATIEGISVRDQQAAGAADPAELSYRWFFEGVDAAIGARSWLPALTAK